MNIVKLPELLLAKKIAVERTALDRNFCDGSYIRCAQRLSSAIVTAREAEFAPKGGTLSG